MKKKLLSILLVVVIVFNFILCNGVYADPGEMSQSLNRYGGNATLEGEEVEQVIQSGKSGQGQTFTHLNFGTSFIGSLLQALASSINTVPTLIQMFISIFAINPENSGELELGESWLGNDIEMDFTLDYQHFTIERAVFNDVSLFNINMFNTKESITNGLGSNTETIYQNPMNLMIKESAAAWFYSARLLAMMINLCVLIYVGIRMALSTIASEEARYKKMLINWAESMVVLFLLHYIMYIIIAVGEIVLNLLYDIRYMLVSSSTEELSFENIILVKVYNAITQFSGLKYFLYSLFFWFLTALHLKFFLTYIKRLFIVAFLTIIAPFITVTYPIDKMGDGRAQAFEAWFQEYMINIAIQPIHAAIYLVFVFTAGRIAEQAPWVAMIFLLVLGRVENMVRNIFGITGGIKNIDEARKGGKKGGMMNTIKAFMTVK